MERFGKHKIKFESLKKQIIVMVKDKKPIRTLELRATDVDPKLHRLMVDAAKKNIRTISAEIQFQLKQHNKMK